MAVADPEDEVMTDEEWQAAWDEELACREHALDEGTCALIDGDFAMNEMLVLASART
jgi:hypothetical protein